MRNISQDPLRPLDTIVRILFFFAVTAIAATLVTTLFGVHLVLGTWGDPSPCVLVSQSGMTISGMGDTSRQIANLHHDVHLGVPDEFRLCQPGMSDTTRALFSIPPLLDLVWTVGFLGFVLRLTGTARRHGLFTTQVARATSLLGTYLLVGWFVVAVVHAACYDAGIGRLVDGYSTVSGFLANFHWNWAALIGSAAAISIGRVMRQTIPMREELDATV